MSELVKKILLPSDGSSHSHEAARYAARLSRTVDADLVLLHVAPGLPEGESSSMLEDELKTVFDRRGNAILEKTGDVVAGEEVKPGKMVEEHFYDQTPAEVICRVAKEGTFDLVVMGSRGLNPLRHLLLGSVSDRVNHICEVPVLLVRKAAPFRTTLVGYDGSDDARHALDLAADFAKCAGCGIHLLYVAADAMGAARAAAKKAAMKEVLSPALRRLKKEGLDAGGSVLFGRPDHVLMEAAGKHGDALLFIGRQGTTLKDGFYFGAVSDRLAHHSPVPVVIVR